MKEMNIYKLRLEQAMEEKMFFLKELKDEIYSYSLIIDFGCGTGKLLRNIADVMNSRKTLFVGYDISEEMLDHATRHSSKEYSFKYTNDLETVKLLMRNSEKTLIIFSTVLHEIPQMEQSSIMHKVASLAHTVVIRDMKAPINNEPIDRTTRKRILKQVAPWQAELFESKWGKIRNKENMYRFFLMNEFVENFETEVEEDYFSPLWSDISWILKDDYGFKLTYERSYTLPYRKKQVKQRFHHVMNDITHREVIYQKQEEK